VQNEQRRAGTLTGLTTRKKTTAAMRRNESATLRKSP
jgi:hypothetical protein